MSKKKAYVGGNIINGDKDVAMIENGCILVSADGKLEYVGEKTDTSGYEVIDVAGKFIMPGMINGHMHLMYTGAPSNDLAGNKMKGLIKLMFTPLGKMLIRGYAKEAMHNQLHSGVTTVRDAGGIYHQDIKMRDEVKSGKRMGPRVIGCGPFIVASAGHGSQMPSTHVGNGPWEMRQAVRENFELQTDWIKICSTGGVGDARVIGEAGMPHMTYEEIEAVCDEAHRRHMMVASHCESTEGMWEALRAGVDTIEHGGFIPEEMVPLFLDNPKTYRGYAALCPTLSAAKALTGNADQFIPSKENKIMLINAEMVAKGCADGLRSAIEHGIKVFIGSDASVPFVSHYNTYKELVYYKEETDLTELEIIDIATKQTSEILNVAEETGTLDVGKSADFIVLADDPRKDLTILKNPVHIISLGNFIKTPQPKRNAKLDALNF